MRRDRAGIFPITCSLLLLLGIAGACTGTYRSKEEAEKAIRAIMSAREQAMERRDINLYMQCIANEYTDGNATYGVIRERMQKNFDAFDRIDFSQFNQTIYARDDSALVVQEYELSFIIGGEKDSIRGKEQIFLRHRDGGWKIIKGL